MKKEFMHSNGKRKIEDIFGIPEIRLVFVFNAFDKKAIMDSVLSAKDVVFLFHTNFSYYSYKPFVSTFPC